MKTTGARGYLYWVRPEVAGGWGPGTTVLNRDRLEAGQDRFPVVGHLHYRFEGWLGDELLTTTPCYIVTSSLAESLRSSGITGFAVGELEVSYADGFAVPDGLAASTFVRLSVAGAVVLDAGRTTYRDWSGDDLCLGDRAELVLSARAFDAIGISRIRNARIATIAPGV